MELRILVFAGSAREASLNKRLARVAAHAVQAAGAAARWVDLRDFPMPIYDGDVEAQLGLPENARRLKDLFLAHHGLLIASPENNGSVSSLLKNTLDWVSRQDGTESGLAPYRGKVAALVAASPGALGGLRGLVHLRQILTSLGVLVLSEQLAVGRAHEAFDGEGRLNDERQGQSLRELAARLVDVTRRLHAEA